MNNPEVISRAAEEIHIAEKNNITILSYGSEHYPSRLKECEDAPVVLFYKGNADLNASKVISMVGTRKITHYGKEICRRFLEELKEYIPDLLVVSGLAYGVDIEAHRQALCNGYPTVGVLAHGLDQIYPAAHRSSAVEMVGQGGILTEYITHTFPAKRNFVSRNRIIAGMSDATIVVESAAKGGSLITADLAHGYHRDCFAFPGRITDPFSAGCNRIIRENSASAILSAKDFVEAMGWDIAAKHLSESPVQQRLFPDLSPEEKLITDFLHTEGNTGIDTLSVSLNIPVNLLHGSLFNLEMNGVIRLVSGGMYELMM